MDRSKVQESCQAILDGYTKDDQKVPGVVFTVIDKNGDTITANASGRRGLGDKKAMDLDTIFWIASCTKLLTAVVCMQLVEKGELHLDDSEHLYKYCPELKKVPVLQEDGTLVDKKKDITLRMLLSHTAGFGYEIFSQKLRDYYSPVGCDVFDNYPADFLNRPLVNQPGERWEYGINIDWAGFYAERVAGARLNDLMIKNIFEPLGLKHMNMFPTDEMKKNLATLHQRWPGQSELVERDHCVRGVFSDMPKEQRDFIVQAGGHGLFAKPTEYVQILAALLNDGTSPKTGKQILEPETVNKMFTNQIPDMPDFSRQGMPAAKPEFTNFLPELYPQEGNPPQGWGLTFQVITQPGPTGRSAGSGSWAGIANCFYWVDREKGIAGMIASQILPFGDMNVLTAEFLCEKAVYESLG